MRTILITGGAGFIGSWLIRHLLAATGDRIINLDKLTYAANEDALREFGTSDRHELVHADICDAVRMNAICEHYQPQAIVHLAAESHVDRSIDGPAAFMATNAMGTFSMLRAAHGYWQRLPGWQANEFRFLHVSTDEVFGDATTGARFTEATAYRPASPYAATKAASDHLVRAWHATYGLPVLVTNCTNNYGPWQFPEKLIPLVIQKALRGESIPVYGDGRQVRDWIHVHDHVRALQTVLDQGTVGETYLIGAGCERQNMDVVVTLCAALDRLRPRRGKHSDLIQLVPDRPGHDTRYAVDAAKIQRELGWEPHIRFEAGIAKTVEWYLANLSWLERIRSRRYGGERLGKMAPAALADATSLT